MESFIYYICKILSYSPVLTISQDNKFGSVEREDFAPEKIRKSLLSFKFGEHVIYIISINENNKFQFIKALSFSKVFESLVPSFTNIDQAYDKYEIEVKNLTSEHKLAHKESLQYKISDIDKIEGQTFNKFLAYLALLVFVIPLFEDVLKSMFEITEFYQKIFTIIIIYQLLNIILFFHSFIKIKTVQKIPFRSIRNSENPENAFILMLYYEWRLQYIYSTKMVALIKNIEKYIACLIITCIFFIAFYNVFEYIDVKKPEDSDLINSSIESKSLPIGCFKNFTPQNELLRVTDDSIFIPPYCSNFKSQSLKLNKGE